MLTGCMATFSSQPRIAAIFISACLLTFVGYNVHLDHLTNEETAVFQMKSSGRSQLEGESTKTATDNRTLRLLYLGESNINLDENMALDAIEDMYFRYNYHLHYNCEDYIRLGLSGDGGWNVCLVEPYRFTKPCLVYSFGINNEFSFDDAVSIKYGCTVRAFDPSMGVLDHRRGPNIWFYNIGISGTDNKTTPMKWKLKTLQTIVDELGDSNRTIDYLKMDVEDAEWESLEAMHKTDILQSRVKQFGIEIHMTSNSNTAEFYRRWKIMKHLEDIGFRRWYWHFNHECAYIQNGHIRSFCYEVVYINTAFIIGKSKTTGSVEQ